ncbi:NUDIX hydrolase [Gaiella sp.]|uniref:NUDIX hydrolase n=1 Tax=Gaiella sp. TaxID=2663207 RepID=UPI002BA2F5DC|nr:NUDIX hydrolase [Gaiella sp.]HWO80976.1 NUDIX hydrolase [Gaiella sp.]
MTIVRAAGGVPVRTAAQGIEVLVVHRPGYDDWTFPKGKCEPGESDEDCALREVVEETGLVCDLEEELPSTAYRDSKGRPKRVRYWRLRVVGGSLAFDHEVGSGRWLSPADAETLLTYERDLAVLRALS